MPARYAEGETMRTSVTALVLGALGALVGGWLVARWCLGLVVIAESGCGVWWGLQRDDGTGPVPVGDGMPRTLGQVLERARGAP